MLQQLDALDPKAPLAVLQPAAPLRHGTRYIVAVCGALGDWGELLPPTPGFQELVEVRLFCYALVIFVSLTTMHRPRGIAFFVSLLSLCSLPESHPLAGWCLC